MAWVGKHALCSDRCHDYRDALHRLASQEHAGSPMGEKGRVLPPEKRRVGSMGNRPKLAAIIHYTEIDEMQNQGIITQCKVIKVNNRRTEK